MATEKATQEMALRQKQIDMLVRIGLLPTLRCQHLWFDNYFTTTYQGRPAVVKGQISSSRSSPILLSPENLAPTPSAGQLAFWLPASHIASSRGQGPLRA